MTDTQRRPLPQELLDQQAVADPGSVPSTETILRLRDVSAGYGRRPAVSGVSVSLEAGHWLAIIGPNGAGKSTVLKAMVGVLGFEGTIEIGGIYHRGRVSAARTIGYVPQQPILPVGMTTAEYVLLGRTAHLGWVGVESADDRRRVAEVLTRMGLAPMAGRPVAELSGGEAQRATLARALVQQAEILVLDEPTSALDLAHQISVLELVDELRTDHGLTVITAMHDLTTASRFADRLLLMAEHRPVAEGRPSEVLTEDVLSRHYRTPVSVLEGPDGGIVVVPLRTGRSDITQQVENSTTPE